jgi:hypothetical protein
MASLLRDVFQECQAVADNVVVQCGKVQFNKSLCRLIKHIYLRCKIVLKSYIFHDSSRLNPDCETALVELRRTMLCGQMLVTDWSRNHWWMSVITSSDSASVGMAVFLNLRDVLLCFKVLLAIRCGLPLWRVEADIMYRICLEESGVSEVSWKDMHSFLRDLKAVSEKDMDSLLRLIEQYSQSYFYYPQ